MTSKITPALAALCALLSTPALAATDCLSTIWTTHSVRRETTTWIENIQTVDYDNDGVLDLVGTIREDAPYQPRTLYSWHGLGGGSFAAPVSMGLSSVINVLTIDANNDGRRDLVVTDYGSIIVRLNTGSGFGPEWRTETGVNNYALSAGYYDVDEYLDLVVTSFVNNQVILLRGDAQGHYSRIAEIATPQYPTSGVLADFDGDGRTDVAYTSRAAKTIEIAYHNEDGTFSTGTVFPTSDYPTDLAVGDFNEDGRPDLVGSHWADSLPFLNDLLVVKNSGSRSYTTMQLNARMQGRGRAFSTVQAIDLTGDNHLDIIADGPNGAGLVTWAGNGDGTFRSPTIFRPPTSDEGLHFVDGGLGDFDGDGDLDIAISSLRDLIVAKNSCGVELRLAAPATQLTYGQPAPLRAALSGISVLTPLPRGTVSFREGQTVLGTAEIGADGFAQLDKMGLSLGTHTIVAYSTGSSQAPDAVSQSVTVNVTTAKTKTTLTPLTETPRYGAPYQIDVKIESGEERLYAYYTLSVDGVESQRYENRTPLSLNLPLGTHSIVAYYYGDMFKPASTSATLTVTIAKSTPTFAHSAGSRSVRAGESHALQFLVGAPAGVPVGGTVQLIRNGSVIASGAVNSSGVAAVGVKLDRGVHPVTAVYSGSEYLSTRTVDLSLVVLSSGSFVVDAYSTSAGIAVASVLPADATSPVLYRRLGGTFGWSVVTLSPSQIDTEATTRGVLYEYRMEATVNGTLATSNVDGALLFTDAALTAGAFVKRVHFDELRLAVNALRNSAGLAPFEFEEPYGSSSVIRASHVAGLRTALAQGRAALGMSTPSFTDASLAGVRMKALHITELRDQTQ